MNRYIVGQVVFFRVRLSDPATGDATDPTTQDPVDDPTIVLTVYAPDGSNSTPALGHVSTGVYTASTTPTLEGQWEYATNSTGAAAGAAKERFYVAPVP
jgi:hypothetical protein